MGFLRKRLQRVGMSRGSANLLLALCTMFLGMSYVMNKIAGAGVPPLEVMAIRYTLAGLLCVPLFRRRLARATARTWRYGIILGLIAFVSSLGIFYGLLVTEASTAAFLTSTAFVFVPLLQTLRHRQLPEPVILLCTGMAAVAQRGLAHGKAVGRGSGNRLGQVGAECSEFCYKRHWKRL